MRILLAVFLLATFSIGHAEELIYHEIKTDSAGHILPWYNATDLGASYDDAINLVWDFWRTMRSDPNGLPYYMNHQVWRADYDDPRGIGGDQFAMALSSWRLLYAYSGDERLKQNMAFIAEYYLTHSLSPASAAWPNIPFPYNTFIYSGQYDGDMMLGYGVTQPDKAGSFALELVHLYKIRASSYPLHATYERYLDAAKKMAHTLLVHMTPGTREASPLPFRVNASTGEIARFWLENGEAIVQDYTTNWAPTMELFLELARLDPENAGEYQKGFTTLLNWMKEYPMKTNVWGPFFEDVPGKSNTQINAVTFARFILEHREYFTNWQSDVAAIFDWTYKILGNHAWDKYGVTVVNEQTIYPFPGESHVARQGATEILYCQLSGDQTRLENAVRELSWATYMVDSDGKNRFPGDENWLTDGYGDYVRHYIWAMATLPTLAPNADHILSSTSVIQDADYKGDMNKYIHHNVDDNKKDTVVLFYRAYDLKGVEVIRLTKKPTQIIFDGDGSSSWQDLGRQDLSPGGVLTITRTNADTVTIL